MNFTNRLNMNLCLLGGLLLLAGCSGAGDSGPSPTKTPEPILVTFDGTECTRSGPAQVMPGEYPFILNNKAEYRLNVDVRILLDEKSNQDFLDSQSEPGLKFALPNWASKVVYSYSSAIDADIFVLDELGEYSVYLYHYYEPKHFWICPPIQVVE